MQTVHKTGKHAIDRHKFRTMIRESRTFAFSNYNFKCTQKGSRFFISILISKMEPHIHHSSGIFVENNEWKTDGKTGDEIIYHFKIKSCGRREWCAYVLVCCVFVSKLIIKRNVWRNCKWERWQSWKIHFILMKFTLDFCGYIFFNINNIIPHELAEWLCGKEIGFFSHQRNTNGWKWKRKIIGNNLKGCIILEEEEKF